MKQAIFLLLQNMDVVMGMDSVLQDGASEEWGHLVCISGPDKSISSDEYYLVVPAWSGDIASPTVSSSAWSLLLLSACLFKVWISSSGISRSLSTHLHLNWLITSFSFFPIVTSFCIWSTLERHADVTLNTLWYDFVFPYFIHKQQVNQWQSVASSTGTGSPLRSLGRAVAAFNCFYTRTSLKKRCQVF